jgi:15-cis-phytoene synthase
MLAESRPNPDDLAYVTGLVREDDRARYYATLFAPASLRADLFALYGFAVEIARIPGLVSEPTLGEVRLQWWRDQLALAEPGQGAGAPALTAIAGAIARHNLPKEPLTALIDARRSDLYADPPARLTDVEGRLGETQSALFQLASLVCGSRGPETAEAAGHAGIAYGIARRLARFAQDRVRGRTILPLDLLVMEELAAADVFVSPGPARLQNVINAMTAFGRHHLRLACTHLAAAPRMALPAFWPLAVVAPLLARAERNADLANRPIAVSDFSMLMRIGGAAFFGLRG